MARLFVQFLLGIVPRPEAEWLQTADAHGAARGGKCEPSHITTVGIVLRTHIVRHEITQRHGVITYVLREFPVRIVLIRAPAVRHFPRRWAYLLCHLYRGDVCPHRVAMVKGVPILWRFSRNARLILLERRCKSWYNQHLFATQSAPVHCHGTNTPRCRDAPRCVRIAANLRAIGRNKVRPYCARLSHSL